MNILYADNSLLALAREALDVHCVALFLPDGDGSFVLTSAAFEETPGPIAVTIAPGKGLVGWIVSNKKPVIVNEIDPQHTRLDYYAPEDSGNIAAFMGFPLPCGGALCVDSVTPRSFTAREQQLLYQLADMVAHDIRQKSEENAGDLVRMYFDQLEQIQNLHRQCPQWGAYVSRFLHILADSTGFDYVAFASRAEGASAYCVEAENTPLLVENNAAVSLPLTSGLVGWVFRDEECLPVHAEGLDGTPAAPLFGKVAQMPNFQSVICLPVTLNRNTCGVICLAGMGPRSMPQNLRIFVRMAVTELSRFLELLYLRHRVQTLLPRAQLHTEGAVLFDPDTAPVAHIKEEE